MELIENQMWTNYWKEQDRFMKVKILVEIVNIQPYISSYYEATKMPNEEFRGKESVVKLVSQVSDDIAEIFYESFCPETKSLWRHTEKKMTRTKESRFCIRWSKSNLNQA